MGKGTERMHFKVPEDEREKAGPHIEMDMTHLETDGSYYDKEDVTPCVMNKSYKAQRARIREPKAQNSNRV